jgi:hypothetical protein
MNRKRAIVVTALTVIVALAGIAWLSQRDDTIGGARSPAHAVVATIAKSSQTEALRDNNSKAEAVNDSKLKAETTSNQRPQSTGSTWMDGRTATNRVKLISQLAISPNPDDWMYASFLAKECQSARAYAELPSEGAKGSAFESWLRVEGKLSDQEVTAARLLVAKAQSTCEEAGKYSEMPFLSGAFKRAKDAGSRVAQMQLPLRTLVGAASWDDIAAEQQMALQRGLADATIASAWITNQLTDLNGQKNFTGALEGLSSQEAGAVLMLATCVLGADCGTESMQRLHTCTIAFACSGQSVEEAIKARFGPRTAELIAHSAKFVGALKASDYREAGLFR